MKKKWILLLLPLLILLPLSAGEAAMGTIANFSFRDFDSDLIGPEGPFRSDGIRDAHFSLTIDGIGALASLRVRRDADGFEWAPGRGAGFRGMRVRDTTGTDLSDADGQLPLMPFLGRLSLEIYLPLSENAEAAEGDYTVTATFIDGSEAKGTARMPAASGQGDEHHSQRKITEARFLSSSDSRHNFVGPNEKLQPGGNRDQGIDLELEGQGQVRTISVQSVSGRFAAWDTLPANRRWLVAVVHKDRPLNESDGGVAFRIRGKTKLTLWLEDNGSIAAGDSTFKVTVRFSDGKEISRIIAAATTPASKPPRGEGLALIGRGTRDLVGPEESLGSDGQADWQFRLDLNTRGTLIGLTLLEDRKNGPTWDTLPGNRTPLVAVTDAEGRILNRQNGSLNLPLYGKTTLYLWVSDRGNRLATRQDFKAKAVFEDGRVLEFTPVTREKPGGQEEKSDKVILRARYLGRQDSDRVSASGVLVGDGFPDSRIRIYMELPARGMRLKEIAVIDTEAPSPSWNTTPGKSRWAMLVTDPGGQILNGTDGSILIDLEDKIQLSLWVADQGRMERRENRFIVRALFENGNAVQTSLLR